MRAMLHNFKRIRKGVGALPLKLVECANVRVKIHGALHVTARQGEVVNASERELCIGERCHIFIPSRVGPQPRLHVLKAMITKSV